MRFIRIRVAGPLSSWGWPSNVSGAPSVAATISVLVCHEGNSVTGFHEGSRPS